MNVNNLDMVSAIGIANKPVNPISTIMKNILRILPPTYEIAICFVFLEIVIPELTKGNNSNKDIGAQSRGMYIEASA